MEENKRGGFFLQRLASENNFFKFLRRISMSLCRISFFIVFFWFGVLKLMELSPAEGVVHTIYLNTVPFVPWKIFIVAFGAYECIIGIIFLFPGKEKWALYMLIPHMITTFAPLVIMPNLVWKGFLIPNLIGQYIIKNLVIVALAIFIAASVWEGTNRIAAEEKSDEKIRKMKRA